MVGQGMDREQGSSYLERPGHALRPSTPQTTLTVLVSLSSAIFPGSGVLEALHPDTTNSTDSSSQSVKRKASSMLRTVLCHSVGRFWSRLLTRSMAAAPWPLRGKSGHPGPLTHPEPAPRGGGGQVLMEASWWPCRESAVTGQVCQPVLCWVSLEVHPLGLSKQKTVNPIPLQIAQPGELTGGQSYGDPHRRGSF